MRHFYLFVKQFTSFSLTFSLCVINFHSGFGPGSAVIYAELVEVVHI